MMVIVGCGGSGSDQSTSTTPKQTSVGLAGGFTHSVAVRSDGTVWYWGMLGTPSYPSHIQTGGPTPLPGIDDAVQVFAGYDQDFIIRADGSLWAFGMNFNGELGDGSTILREIPAVVVGMNGVKTLSSCRHTLAVMQDGRLFAWGANDAGELGDGTTLSKTVPTLIPTLNGVQAVACGSESSIALKEDKTVWTWGGNSWGELGRTTGDTHTPQQVDIQDVIGIAMGDIHALALKSDGTVWAWGQNHYGQLGVGNQTFQRETPTQVPGLTGVVVIGARGRQSYALKSDGTVYLWGRNNYGQQANNSTTNVFYPTECTLLKGFDSVCFGNFHGLAMSSDGNVWAWGCNDESELGISTPSPQTTPVQIGFQLK